ncbi:uncharacterized protein LOC144539735 [Centroberyx gerrardi]
MDGEQRDRRAWSLAVVVTVQSVLVAACLAVTLHVYWGVQQRQDLNSTENNEIYIRFEVVSAVRANQTLEFGDYTGNNVSLSNNSKSKIYIGCTGPYILHMYVCCTSNDVKGANGTLVLLLVGGGGTPLSSFSLQQNVCRGLHSTVYLKAKEEASLYFSSPDNLKIKNVTLGLSYLLGRKCIH